MCDVCEAEGHDPKFRNGTHTETITKELSNVFRGAVAVIKLCYIHDIELYVKGEKQFLREHIGFARYIASNSGKFSRSREDF